MATRGFVCIRVLMRFGHRFLFSSLTVVPGGCGGFFPLHGRGYILGNRGPQQKESTLYLWQQVGTDSAIRSAIHPLKTVIPHLNYFHLYSSGLLQQFRATAVASGQLSLTPSKGPLHY